MYILASRIRLTPIVFLYHFCFGPPGMVLSVLTLDNGVATAVFVIKKSENDDKKMMTRKNDDIKKADSHHLQWKSASNFFSKKTVFFVFAGQTL